MIKRFFKQTFTNSRGAYEADIDGNKKSSLSEVGSFSGHRQQASQDLVERFNLSFQTAFSIWCPVDTDVKIGDVVDEGGYRFTVRGIQENNYGRNQHLELAVDGGEKITQES